MRNLSIHLLHAIVSFTPSCVPLFLRPMCIDEIRFILCPCFLFSIYLSPPPRYKRASAVCDISTPVNWQESHLLFRFVAPFWLLLVYKYVEGGYSKFFFFSWAPPTIVSVWIGQRRLQVGYNYSLYTGWIVGVCNRMTQISSPSSTSFMSCIENVSGFYVMAGKLRWTAVGNTFLLFPSSIWTVQIKDIVCLFSKDGVIFFLAFFLRSQ